MPAEFVPRPATGRVVHLARHVGLGDVRPDNRLRLDALARFLMDVADEDGVDADLGPGIWILRRLAVRFHNTPRFRADLDLATWCGGFGPRWAERRTDVAVDGVPCVETVAIWAHVDPATGAPTKLPPRFNEVFGAAAAGRKVSARLVHEPPPAGAQRAPWFVRAVDLDLLGHVNNAAYWAAVEEELARRSLRVRTAELEFRSGIDAGEQVEVRTVDREGGFALWLCVGDDVRASAIVGSET